MQLTPRQLEVLRFIVDFRMGHGISPTLAEIAERMGISKITVYEHVEQLIKKGVLEKQKYQSRSLSVNPEVRRELEDLEGGRGSRFPLLGRIAAGRPIEAVEDKEDLDISDLFPPDKPYYVLKVKGSSMIDEQICPGDYVIVENRAYAEDGETVVAIIGDNEATLKKFYSEGKRFRLQPANPDMEPIYVDRLEIRGVVVGVLRKY